METKIEEIPLLVKSGAKCTYSKEEKVFIDSGVECTNCKYLKECFGFENSL